MSKLDIAQAKVDTSKKWLIRAEMFFATMIMSLINKPSDDDGTMATDGKSHFWSLDFVINCSQSMVTFVVLHECLHVALKHCVIMAAWAKSKPSFDANIFNQAADHLVNGLIVVMGLKDAYDPIKLRWWSREAFTQHARRPEYICPEDACFDPKFLGMDLLTIYNILMKEKAAQEPEEGEGEPDGAQDGQGTAQDGQGDGQWGEIKPMTGDDGEPATDEEITQADKEISRIVKTAVSLAKGRGQMPGWLADAIGELNAPSQDYREVFRDMLVDTMPEDYTFAKQSRRSMGDVIMPGTLKEGLGHVGIMTDASGSVNDKEFTQFCSDWMAIAEELRPQRMTMLQFDYTCGDPEIVEMGEEPELVRRKNGGTKFSAPFEHCRDLGILEDFDVIIVFTDGGDSTWPTGDAVPDCPVIWATTGAFYEGDPPFGEVIQVAYN